MLLPTNAKKILRRATHAKALTAVVVSLLALCVTKLVFGVGPVIAIKHAPWFAYNDIDSIPVFVQTMPMMTGQVPWDLNTPLNDGHIDRVEDWGVSSSAARDMLQERNVATSWWRGEAREVLQHNANFGDTVLDGYPQVMGLVMQDFVEAIPNDVLMDQLGDKGAPGTLHVAGCKPATQYSRPDSGIFYNIGIRSTCDNVIGLLVWLLSGSLIALLITTVHSRRAAKMPGET